MYPNCKDKLFSFNLIKTKGRHGIERVKTLYLDMKEPLATFSCSGNWLALVDKAAI